MSTIYVFIDASNLWAALKAKGKFMDFEKAIKHIKEKFNGTLIRTFYYTAYPAEGTRSYSKVFVFSSENNVSQELRTGADGYTDILEIEDIWGKELKHRAELEKERK